MVGRVGHRTIVVKTELNRKVKLSVYQSGPHLWVLTQRTRWWTQVDETSVLLMVAGLGLDPPLLCVERFAGSGIRSGSLLDWRFSGDPGPDPEPSGGIMYLIWPGNASG